MQEHVHTGIVAGVFVVTAWLIGFNLLKLAAIEASGHQQTEWVSKLIGSLISTGAA